MQIATDKSQWLKLMRSLGLADFDDTYHSLIDHYNQKHRRYHNQTHLRAVLDRLNESRHLANDALAIEIALWFHDAIYKISSSTNEKDSADWAVAFLREAGASVELIEKVYALIMATQHNAVSADNDETLLVDIDLSILGGSVEVYNEFEIAIREEYRSVPWFIYKRKRAQVLAGFLERERIYTHSYFFDKLESNARVNLSNAIANLKSA